MANLAVYDDLVLLLRSIALFHPDMPVFVLAQPIVKERLQKETGLPTNLTITLGLEKYGVHHWKLLNDLEKLEFGSQKSVTIEQALEHHSNTLYVDADVIIASPLGLVDDSKDLGLSPRFPVNTNRVGKYNSGWIFVNNKKFPHWWRSKIAKASFRFMEQKCLGDAPKHFDLFHFPPNYNLRLKYWADGYDHKSRRLIHYLLRINSDSKKGITYKNKPVISLHDRFNTTDSPWCYFIIVHLYKGKSQLFELINSKTNYPLSDKSLFKKESYVFAIQLNKCATKAIERKTSFLYLGYTRSSKTNITRYYYKLVQKIVLIILYPYYLINEEVYFYHATHRLANRKLSWQALIKILGQAFYHFSKRELQRLFFIFQGKNSKSNKSY